MGANKMKLYTDLVEENDFHRAWTTVVQMVLMNGSDLVIGGAEQRKPIKDSCMLISLEGEAIKQIERRELHPQFPTKEKHLDVYCKEYTREFLKEYKNREGIERFSYLYFARLIEYKEATVNIDQISWIRRELEKQILNNVTSNRIQAITWHPLYDRTSSPPCLQRIQIRYIPENKVDIHLTWRSRDLFTAWQTNIIALVDMLNREVVKPNGCKIIRLMDYNDSLHIYTTDISEAEKVKFTGAL